MTIYKISHITEYKYESAASLSYNEARLLPRPLTTFLYDQQVSQANVDVEPGWTDYRERRDFFGNRVLYYTLRQAHDRTVITAQSQVEIRPNRLADSTQPGSAAHWLQENRLESSPWESVVQQLRHDPVDSCLDARQYALPSPLLPQLAELVAFAQSYFPPGRPLVDAALSLMEGIFTDFDFVSGATDIATPISEVMETRKGVCQDFAHLMIGALRSQGLAARYMSGYIETLPLPGKEKLEGADASHAWCALFVPELGWLDFDPTNNLVPTDQHVIIGWGRDFGDITPLKGIFYGGSNQSLDVSVSMNRL